MATGLLAIAFSYNCSYADDWIAALQTAGRYVAVETHDSLAFFASEWGLEVFSIGDPASPTRLSSTPTPGIATDLELDSRYAYVADSGHGLLVFDCLSPVEPKLVAADTDFLSLTPYPYITSMLRVDTILYVTVFGSTEGLYLFNVANPPSTYLASKLKLFSATDSLVGPSSLTSIDSLLYIFDVFGFWVTNVTDPGHPTKLGHYRHPSGTWRPQLSVTHGARLFMYDGQFTRQFDVSDQSFPIATTFQILVDTSDEQFSSLNIKGLQTHDGSLILATYATGLKKATIPQNPTDSLVLGPLFDTPGFAWAFAFQDSVIVVADGDKGVECAVDRLGQLDSLGYFGQRGFTGIHARVGRYLLLHRPKGLYVVDAAQPASPMIVDSILTDHVVNAAEAFGDRLYVMELSQDTVLFHTRLYSAPH